MTSTEVEDAPIVRRGETSDTWPTWTRTPSARVVAKPEATKVTR